MLSRPRSHGHSNHVDDQCSEPDKACKVDRLFFVACCDAATSLDASKESLDLVSVFVGFPIVTFLHGSSWVGFDADLGFELLAAIKDRVGIVGRVGNQRTDLALFERVQQSLALRSITSLACGEDEADQFSGSPRHRMDFCG